MSLYPFAHLVARANIQRLSLIGLAENVGKTTATNHLLETLLGENFYRAQELALTSLGLDGEAIDALTGLPTSRADTAVVATATRFSNSSGHGPNGYRRSGVSLLGRRPI